MLRVLLLIVAVCLIIISLLQGGKTDGLSAFTGSGGELFQNVKERGPEKIISYVTLGLGIVFFLLAIVIRVVE